MTITQTQTENGMILAVEGRVDTITSPQLQDEVLHALQTAKLVVLDLTEVQYVSSAGLRVLLIGQKTAASKGSAFELHHVAETVMAVLRTVGFDKVLTIK